jgi:GNAT superfamily N-acetyltransferase
MPPRDLPNPRELSVSTAVEDDAAELLALHTSVADDLTARFGRGHWSSRPTEKVIRWAIRSSRVIVGRSDEGAIVATLTLQTKKPWAIDRSYFTEVPRPLYLVSMAVLPSLQRRNLGRRLLEEAREVAEAYLAQSIRLDAYDAAAGAGGFYAKCGYSEVGRVSYKGTPLVYYELML